MHNFFAPFPFVRYCLAYITGILLFLGFEIYLDFLPYLIAVFSLTYCLIYFKIGAKARAYLGYSGLLTLVLLGYYNTYNSFIINDLTNINHAKPFLFYKVKIISLVEEKPRSWKATAMVISIKEQNKFTKKTGKILLYFDKNTVPKPSFGDMLLIKNSPSKIEPPKNPKQFDYKRYLSLQGIYHQQYLKDTSIVKINATNKLNFKQIAISINNFSDSLFTRYFNGKTELAVTNAMVLGLRDDIDNELLSAYSAAGAIHVLSVSGLHVGVIYIILVWLFSFLKKVKLGGVWLYLGIILAILWLYAAVTGFSAPVMRSTFMFSIILLAKTFNKQHNGFNTLAVSAFCILFFDPLAITNVGFMLSYLAVFGMILIQPILNPLLVIDKKASKIHWLADRIWKVTTVALAAQIATLPITIYYFHQFPNYFLLVNPVVILLSSVVLLGGLLFLLLASILSLFKFFAIINGLAFILELLVRWLNFTVQFTEKLPGAVAKYLNFNILEVLVLYLLILAIIAIIKLRNYTWVNIAFWATSILVVFSIKNFIQTKSQYVICLHAIPNATAISVIDGTKTTLFADSLLLADNKIQNFYLSNFWAQKGTINLKKEFLPHRSILKIWQNKKFLFLNDRLKKTENEANLVVDYLIIRNKKINFLYDIKGKISFKYLIIDGNISKYYAEKIEKEAAQEGVLAYSLIKNGALLL